MSVKLVSTLASLLICVVLIICGTCIFFRFFNKKKRLTLHNKNRATGQNEAQGPVITHINRPVPTSNQDQLIDINEYTVNENPSAPIQTPSPLHDILDSNPPSYSEVMNKPASR